MPRLTCCSSSNALAQIRAFGKVADDQPSSGTKDKTKKKKKTKKDKQATAESDVAVKPAAAAAPSGGVTDCCICKWQLGWLSIFN